MIAQSIQPDYGGFDPKFLGITLRFHTRHPSTWELFNEISTTGRNPEKVLEIGDAALDEEPEKAFEVFSVGTVMLHELRHFHDFILSPYGNYIFRLRLYALLNGIQAIAFSLKNRKTIPCPISVWRKKSTTERTAFLSLTQRMIGGKIEVEPFELPEKAQTLADQTEVAYRLIKDLVTNPQTASAKIPFYPSHLFEASAVIAQIQNVYSVFGVEHAELFMNLLLNDESAQSYSVVFSLLAKLWLDEELPIDTERMSAIVSWSISGDYTTDHWNACPTIRFARLFELLLREGPPLPSKSCSELFEEWTKKLSVTPVPTALNNAAIVNGRLLTKLEKLSDEFPATFKQELANITHAMRNLAIANKHMANLFLSDPTLYVNPWLYTENAEIWVAAPVAVNFIGGGLLMQKKDLERINVHKAREHNNGQELAVYRALLPGQTVGVDIIDPEVALKVFDMLTIADYFFAEFRRDDPDFEIVRQSLEKDGITPLELLW